MLSWLLILWEVNFDENVLIILETIALLMIDNSVPCKGLTGKTNKYVSLNILSLGKIWSNPDCNNLTLCTSHQPVIQIVSKSPQLLMSYKLFAGVLISIWLVEVNVWNSKSNNTESLEREILLGEVSYWWVLQYSKQNWCNKCYQNSWINIKN